MSANTLQTKLTVSCQCAQFNATVLIDERNQPTRLKCYCVDCQTYARHLNKANAHLDEKGGTDVLQISPARFSITKGQEYLGNLMLSPKEIYRWHTSCCQTPICNTTTNANMPYAGLLTNNIIHISSASSEKERQLSNCNADNKEYTKSLSEENRNIQLNEAIGPVEFGVGAGDKHPIKANWPVAKGFGFRGMFGTLKNMATWRLRGDHKHSIFVDSVSGKPLVEPTILTLEQRQMAKNEI